MPPAFNLSQDQTLQFKNMECAQWTTCIFCEPVSIQLQNAVNWRLFTSSGNLQNQQKRLHNCLFQILKDRALNVSVLTSEGAHYTPA
jgi:hypothetical protein